jgi:hypothetical protein
MMEMVMKCTLICSKCKTEFETKDSAAPLCYECQHDADSDKCWDSMIDEIEREERYREQDGLDAPYE